MIKTKRSFDENEEKQWTYHMLFASYNYEKHAIVPKIKSNLFSMGGFWFEFKWYSKISGEYSTEFHLDEISHGEIFVWHVI